ncbi:MAG: 4-hydroxy-tetrahydrodipicolinate reductase [bacterium]
MIKILISGAAGKMGREVVKAVKNEADMKLVGAVDIAQAGTDAGASAGIGSVGIVISKDLKAAINDSKPDVAIDFTHPSTAMANTRIILDSKVHAVIGTTGLTDDNLSEIRKLCSKNKVNCIAAPNFAIGAVLMMMFARTAIKYMPNAEIIELHHDKKVDIPSGTALKTAELMNKRDIRIHSVRLPGLVAHQEVIFGGIGQTLTIRHDSLSRESFMPGVIMAVQKVRAVDGLVYGLENLLS